MKPSVFGSFCVFILIGLWTTLTYKFKTDPFVIVLLWLTIFFSALYYYYLNLATEKKFMDKLESCAISTKIASWFLIAFQYSIVSGMWFLLRIEWEYYAWGLIALNSSYLAWDCLHNNVLHDDPSAKIMFRFDGAHLALSVCLLITTWTLPPEVILDNSGAHIAMLVELACVFLILTSVAGLIWTAKSFKYNPFKLTSMNNKEIWPNAE